MTPYDADCHNLHRPDHRSSYLCCDALVHRISWPPPLAAKALYHGHSYSGLSSDIRPLWDIDRPRRHGMGKPANPKLVAVWRGCSPDWRRKRGRMVRSRAVRRRPNQGRKMIAPGKRHVSLLLQSTVRGRYYNDCWLDRALCISSRCACRLGWNCRPDSCAFRRRAMA